MHGLRGHLPHNTGSARSRDRIERGDVSSAAARGRTTTRTVGTSTRPRVSAETDRRQATHEPFRYRVRRTKETAMRLVTSTPHRNSSTFSVDVKVPNWCDGVETALHRHRNTIAKFQKRAGGGLPPATAPPQQANVGASTVAGKQQPFFFCSRSASFCTASRCRSACLTACWIVLRIGSQDAASR